MFWVQVGLALVIVIGAWAALKGSVQEPVLAAPSHIGDMKRTSVVTGEEAMRQVQEMHQGHIRLTDGYIAEYQNGAEKMTLWVALAEKESDASKVLADMAGAISKGGTPFSIPVKKMVSGREMFFATGAGGSNYFFSAGHNVVWVLLAGSSAPEKRVNDVLDSVKFE